jgi:hypothetical protein
MRSYLRIKGKNLWKLCALFVMGIAVAACYIQIQNISQPATATVGQTITIQLTDSIQTNITGTGYIVANYVLGILLPKGFSGAANTQVSYTSGLGNGNMSLMPATTLEPGSASAGTNLNWPASMMKMFGIRKNLVNDLEWVVFQSNQQYTIDNEAMFPADATIKLKVGADNNSTEFFTAFVIAESYDGLTYWGGNASDPNFNEKDGGCLIVNGGTTGVLNDFCHPQLITVDPPKSTSNEFITLTFNNKLTPTGLTNTTTPVYLCVDTAYTNDGKALTNFCMQTEKSEFVQTTANSGIYTLTIWPASYFGLTASETVTRMVYHITDQTGTIRVGYGGDPITPFSYVFGCQ